VKKLRRVTLELSLKPFYNTTPEGIAAVCRTFFAQWMPLLRQADTVGVLFFPADGSEILEYRGRLDDPFNWANLIGGANERHGWDKQADPQGLSLHTTCYLYRADAPVMTYRLFREIVAITRQVGKELCGKPVFISTMFDPGPEFAHSDFKYKRHPEILLGNTMGQASFVCCYSTLRAENRAYAGFPDGIPDQTPFGLFFGRQCQAFLTDLGFDSIWLSNGFGFGSESWGTTGALFDGQRFIPEQRAETSRQIRLFWQLFRSECHFPVETRGTNLTAGIDLATDGVDLQYLYSQVDEMQPPPNSPWAALNGDFGLEIAGFLSRTAVLPEHGHFLYRFYVHDPWWMNSPWLDRYERQPHDIYLPLATARLNEAGEVKTADCLNLLTIDNSLGELPDQCPLEIIPHLLQAYAQEPDAPAPFVWLYPFRAYHEQIGARLSKPFFEDWLIRDAINAGLPLSMVVHDDACLTLLAEDLQRAPADSRFSGSVLITPVPPAKNPLNQALLRHVARGGHVFLYGSTADADPELLGALNLAAAGPLTGNLALDVSDSMPSDSLDTGAYAVTIDHDPILADGGLQEILLEETDPATQVLATVRQGANQRVFALSRAASNWQGGRLFWLRGSNSGVFRGGHLLDPRPSEQVYPAAQLFRRMLSRLGWLLRLHKTTPGAPEPVVLIHRHDQAFYYACYLPDTTVGLELSHPLGAPLLIGQETIVQDTVAQYHLPRSSSLECRVFVSQPEKTVLSCRETAPASFQFERRLRVSGLKQATVVYLPPTGLAERCEVLLNSRYPHQVGDPLTVESVRTPYGQALVVRQVSGSLMLSTPRLNADATLRFPPQEAR
jgi:hypothetical protein